MYRHDLSAVENGYSDQCLPVQMVSNKNWSAILHLE